MRGFSKTAQVTIAFEDRGYVGHPFWAEREKLINIQKESGMMRSRTMQNRANALEQYLRDKGLGLKDYEELKARADRPFYFNAKGEIIIPILHLEGCLVEAAYEAKSALRLCEPKLIRVLLRLSDFRTNKTVEDAQDWSRFAVVTAGTGAKLSNQRALRENKVLHNFEAQGNIAFRPDHVSPDRLKSFLEFAGWYCGVGASRKMGFGRYEVTRFDVGDTQE